ncbi:MULTISPECIES: nucleoside triphosphate pyrophosphohydrolase [Cysteiniphilum]|uniref:nucleoside triphosphate pyrophosphohydrolase n=1 Tax=Cysteiniphilum TaxID=2056696 RepID=UPI00177ED56A|nr:MULTISPECIES: nucleoside triphosphate pyrophosphohydrolase [Cysteiniphilum]
MSSKTLDKYQLTDLLEVMSALRDRDKGCAWSLEQTWQSLTEYTIEEAYELVDAIENHATDAVKYELADLLNQVIFYAQIAKEQSLFDLEDIVDALTQKLIVRHPDVFAKGNIKDVEALERQWLDIKRRERGKLNSELDGIALNLPALTIAKKMQTRASGIGFDWQKIEDVFAKLESEVDELKEVLLHDQHKAQEELGDLLFSCVNLARHLKADPEALMRQANQKFARRFRGVEAVLKAQDRSMLDTDADELNRLWELQKQAE